MTRLTPFAAALAVASICAAWGSQAVAAEEAPPPTEAAPSPAVPSPRAEALALVAPGTSVRLTSRLVSGHISGRVLSADGESLQILPRRGGAVRVPYASLTALDVTFGSRRHVREGLLVGLLLGVLVGATAEVDDDLCDWDEETYCSRGEALAAGVAGGGLLGAGIGALIKTDRWQAVAIDELRVGLVPLRGRGAGLALAVAW
jgi:hypothetical protein